MNSNEYNVLHAQIQLLKQHVLLIEQTLALSAKTATASARSSPAPARTASPAPVRSASPQQAQQSQVPPTVRILQRPATQHKQGVDIEPLTVPVRGPFTRVGPLNTRRAGAGAAAASSSAATTRVPFDLADVLQEGETMVIKVKDTASNEEGAVHTAVVQFDGSELTVLECEKVPSLVGKKSVKAGNLVYAFIQGLYYHKQIARTFTAPPWKLCFVKHDGVWLSMNEVYKARFPHGPFASGE